MKNDLVVIGGGASGMLLAAEAAKGGGRVLLVEKNERLGVKLRITGKGRCNVTNNCSARELMDNVPGNGRFLFSAFSGFGSGDAMALFESLGVPLKTERGNRVFPVSDRAADVAEALIREMDKNGVRVMKARALSVFAEDGRVIGVKTSRGDIECTAAAICTGGLSYPKTGSDGDGYRMAEELGHSVTALSPSLVALETEDACCPAMQGLSLRNVQLTAFDGRGKKIFSELGELQFTHFGVSGPLVLSASAHMRDFKRGKYSLSIDLKPGLDEQKLDARLLRDFEKYKNRAYKNALDDLEARLMIPVLVERSGIDPDEQANSVTRAERRRLLKLLKDFRVTVKGPRSIDEAVITAGGISTKEIDPATMESKLVKGLYFAGEVIDADAYTGGFNLQIAWATAMAAARSILQAEGAK